jgi:hypothetical protein
VRRLGARSAGLTGQCRDMVSGEACYHSVCYLSFCTPKKNILPLGRQKDPEKSEAFAKLCNFLISNNECQLSLIELSDKLRYYLPDNIENYSIKHLSRMPASLWGWKHESGQLYPVPTLRLPAPDELLNILSCNCQATCSGKCSCVRAGLRCSHMCSQCNGATSNSALVLTLTEEDLAILAVA